MLKVHSIKLIVAHRIRCCLFQYVAKLIWVHIKSFTLIFSKYECWSDTSGSDFWSQLSLTGLIEMVLLSPCSRALPQCLHSCQSYYTNQCHEFAQNLLHQFFV